MRPVPGFEGAGRIILVKKQKQKDLLQDLQKFTLQ